MRFWITGQNLIHGQEWEQLRVERGAMRWRDLGVAILQTLRWTQSGHVVGDNQHDDNSGCPSTTFCLDAIDHRARLITTTTPASIESNVKANVYMWVDG
jgi:hypothetical protein